MLFNNGRLLFLDHRHIERAENVTLTMNPAAKCGPCLFIEKEWEMRGARGLCIVEWEGVYRFYYQITLELSLIHI